MPIKLPSLRTIINVGAVCAICGAVLCRDHHAPPHEDDAPEEHHPTDTTTRSLTQAGVTGPAASSTTGVAFTPNFEPIGTMFGGYLSSVAHVLPANPASLARLLDTIPKAPTGVWHIEVPRKT